jgi:hypothetical protein
MTRAQVARRRFKSSLPRTKILDVELSPRTALARTMELLGRFRDEVVAEGLSETTVQGALVFCQPHTKGKEAVLAQVKVVPEFAEFSQFFTEMLTIDKPVFLGMLFWQHDPDARDEKQSRVMFGCAFTKSHDAEARLLAARNQQALGGLKSTAN